MNRNRVMAPLSALGLKDDERRLDVLANGRELFAGDFGLFGPVMASTTTEWAPHM